MARGDDSRTTIDRQQDHRSERERQPAEPSGDLLNEQPTSLHAGALVGDPRLGERGNGPVRVAVMQQAQRTHGNRAVQRYLQRQSTSAAVVIQRRPDYLVDHSFLGWSCHGGVNPIMKQRLQAVETHLTGIFNALPADQRINPLTNTPATNLKEWSGIRQAHGCWRPHGGKHSSGSACDINYDTNPYIATRSEVTRQGRDGQSHTRTVQGGEVAGAGLAGVRQSATEVYDRAVRFMHTSAESADVSARRGHGDLAQPGVPRETTGSIYDRFQRTSDSLRDYMQFAFRVPDPRHDRVNRAPVRDPETATEEQLLQGIPETERLPQSDGVQRLRTYMQSPAFQTAHPGWTTTPEQQYIRILRDYELVRVPMVYGNTTARPGSTRNPALGFLDLRKELVEALADIGHLRWGASDFGTAESGDVQHFDLGSHGGFTPGDE